MKLKKQKKSPISDLLNIKISSIFNSSTEKKIRKIKDNEVSTPKIDLIDQIKKYENPK